MPAICKIAAVLSFPGLHHFHKGRGFKQWTWNDSKGLMKVHLHSLSFYQLLTLSQGVSPHHCRICSFRDGESHLSSHQLHLSCSTQCDRWDCCGLNPEHIGPILSPPRDLLWGQDLSWQILASPTTLPLALHLLNHTIWCPKWSLLIDYQIKTYQGSQENLLLFKQEQAPRSNANHQPAHQQNHSHLCWFQCTWDVTFEWNVLLDLSGGTATKTFCSLNTELLL